MAKKQKPPDAVLAQRARLVADVYETLFAETEHFSGNTGVLVAYLLGGLATGQKLEMDPSVPAHKSFHRLLRKAFPPGHEVWASVELEAAQAVVAKAAVLAMDLRALDGEAEGNRLMRAAPPAARTRTPAARTRTR